MKFGKQLGLRVQPSLKDKYIDYRGLKARLAKSITRYNADAHVADEEAELMRSEIDREIDQVDAFFVSSMVQARQRREDIVREVRRMCAAAAREDPDTRVRAAAAQGRHGSYGSFGGALKVERGHGAFVRLLRAQ